MAFMTLNGLVVSVENDSAEWRYTGFGEQSNSFLNRPKRHRKGVTEEISFSSCLMAQEDADSLIGIVERVGHHISFESDAWSDRGLGPESGSTYTLTSGGYTGTKRAVLTSPTLVYNPEFREAKNTVCYARTADSGSTWEHVTVRADGAKWTDGVRDDAASTSELVVSNGAVNFSSAFDYDEIELFPFNISDQHALELFAFVDAGNPFTIRLMELSGDIIENAGSINVISHSDGQTFSQGSKNATWLNNLRTVDFTLSKAEI